MSEEDEEEGELYYHDEEICNLDLVTEIIHHLIRRLRKDDLPDGIEILYGGFPCQNISCAGNGRGLEGERSSLFFEIVRLAKEIKPKFLFLENVAGITCNGGLQVVREIASLGYDCRWCIISAASVGAPHKRDRWFLLAHSNEQRMFKRGETNREKQNKPPLPDTPSFWRESEPQMVGVDDGLSKRMDCIRALGNAVVPQQAEKAFRLLMYGE